MNDNKILDNNELNEVTGGGIFGSESEQLFRVGDIVIASIGPDPNSPNPSSNRMAKVIECLGLEGVFYSTYEYMVKFENGSTMKVTQSRLRKIYD